MIRAKLAAFFATLLVAVTAFGSAYQASPKLVVILVIDQFRGDYLERYHAEFGPNGFRNFTERGAYFPACYYQYANTRTAPGHATIGTGTYSSGHGIFSNEWWDPAKKAMVSSVDDPSTRTLGAEVESMGASPHNLLADTLADELRLATQGRSRVYGVALKDRAAILPTGFTANAAFWIEKNSGVWVTSTYYMNDVPHWLTNFNSQKHADKYLNLEWKDNAGEVMGSTAPKEDAKGNQVGYYDLVGATPFANDYEFEFARELIQQEKLGHGTVTDLLVLSLSANDILGHQVGPDAPQMHAMALTLDRQIADFLSFLNQQYGAGQVWVALTADHGMAPLQADSFALHIPAQLASGPKVKDELNKVLGARLKKPGNYIRTVDYPFVFLSQEQFPPNVTEADAEVAAAEAMRSAGFLAAYTKEQIAAGELPPTGLGHIYANSYSPYGGWWVMGVPFPFSYGPGGKAIADHGAPYGYDQHVPLAFYGAAFKTGVYRDQVEPVDLAPTLAVMLGVNRPTNATGRVLTEAIAGGKLAEDSSAPAPAPARQRVQQEKRK
jgi:predicted AlkP superfamily pyrophosphatase or phosphodiesterase